MVTKNWYNYFKSNRTYGVITDGLTDINGTKKNAGYYQTSGYSALLLAAETAALSYTTANFQGSVVFGSDGTPPTIDDYKLNALITSGLSASVAISVTEDGDPVRTYTITNTSANDITIAEIGMIYKCYTLANQTGGTVHALFERTTLDSPVTIPAGGIGKVTYTIRMNYPTA